MYVPFSFRPKFENIKRPRTKSIFLKYLGQEKIPIEIMKYYYVFSSPLHVTSTRPLLDDEKEKVELETTSSICPVSISR